MRAVAGRAALWVLIAAAACVLVLSVLFPQRLFVDLDVYRFGGEMWLADQALYADSATAVTGNGRLPFTYPPFAAMLFTVLAVMPLVVAVGVMTAASLASAYAVVRIVGRRLTTAFSTGAAAAVTVFALLSEPARETLLLGQVNLILAVVVAAECLLPRTPWPRGVLLGAAAAVKLTPAVFVLFFVLSNRWRAAVTTVGSFAGCTLLAAALAPSLSLDYWLHTILDPGRIGPVFYGSNQSLLAVLSRWELDDWLETGLWVAAGVTVLVLAVWLARRALRARHEVEGLLVIAIAGLLVAPISWSHHWVLVASILFCVGWCVIPGLATRSPVRAVLALMVLAVVLIGPYRLVPWDNGRELAWSPLEQLAGASLVLIGLGVLAAVSCRGPGWSTPATCPVLPERRAPRRPWPRTTVHRRFPAGRHPAAR